MPMLSNPPTADQLNKPSDKKLLRIWDLEAEYGFKPSSVYLWMKTKGFPQPVRFGKRYVAWHRDAVEAWIAAMDRAHNISG